MAEHKKQFNCSECENSEGIEFVQKMCATLSYEEAKQQLAEQCYLCNQCNELDPFLP